MSEEEIRAVLQWREERQEEAWSLFRQWFVDRYLMALLDGEISEEPNEDQYVLYYTYLKEEQGYTPQRLLRTYFLLSKCHEVSVMASTVTCMNSKSASYFRECMADSVTTSDKPL